MGLKRAIKLLLKLLPKQARLDVAVRARWLLHNRRIAGPYLGQGRLCPCCGQTWREFVPAGNPPRAGELCLRCGGGRRQRLMAHFLRQDLKGRGPLRLLHFAPEVSLSRVLRRLPGVEYLSVDIDPEAAMMGADIEDLPFEDASFDVLVCSHVLEHVEDDARAMREMRRVLGPSGVAYVMVPQDFGRERTREDPSIVDPVAREREFGQSDHVRLYGRDFADRLAAAGFSVANVQTRDVADEQTVRVYDLRDDVVYVCRPGGQGA